MLNVEPRAAKPTRNSAQMKPPPALLFDATFVRATSAEIFVEWPAASVERLKGVRLPKTVQLPMLWLTAEAGGKFAHECPKQLQRLALI